MKAESESAWRLRFDLLFTRAMLWFAGAGRTGEPTPEVHRYLADRYARLATYHHGHGHQAAAQRLWGCAEFHHGLAGPDDPPPAVAVAMPVPQRPTFTDAVARWSGGDPPGGAA
jgi:hypothetical protein